MNILVIGNGFDLAHELPTKYTDFLDFCKIIRSIYTAEMYADIYRCWDYLSFKEREKKLKIRRNGYGSQQCKCIRFGKCGKRK